MSVLTVAANGGNEVITAWDISDFRDIALPGRPVTLEESTKYSFKLKPAPAEFDYMLRIGDDENQDGDNQEDTKLRFEQTLVWPEKLYFESARGWTTIYLYSRSINDLSWQRSGSFRTYILPTKIGEDRYQAMSTDIRRLSGALLLDLMGKSRINIGITAFRKGVSFRTKELELLEVERVWRRLRPLLDCIGQSPAAVLDKRVRQVSYWGERDLSPHELRQLAIRGLHPGHPGCVRPIRVTRETLNETVDIPEHRILAGFVKLLQNRLTRCVQAIREHSQAIERDKQYRDVSVGGQPSLYEVVDRPRLMQLIHFKAKATSLYAEAYKFLRRTPFNEVAPVCTAPTRAQFCINEVYREARILMDNYLRSSSLWIDDLPGTAISKLTSRLYEQWVFLSLVEAFRHLGVELKGWREILKEASNQRFTIDFERGLGFVARLTSNKWLRVRYEPWIFSRVEAKKRQEELCHGGSNAIPWSPDILLECLAGTDAKKAATIYAIALDCKYSVKIFDHHWQRTRKYLQIRSSSSGIQIVRQLWLASPNENYSICMMDPALTFDKDYGANCGPDETVEAILSAVPGTVSQTETPIQVFAAGTLRYLTRL